MIKNSKRKFKPSLFLFLLVGLVVLPACSLGFGSSDSEEEPIELAVYEPSVSKVSAERIAINPEVPPQTEDSATERVANNTNAPTGNAITTGRDFEKKIASTDLAVAVEAILPASALEGRESATIALTAAENRFVRGDYSGEVVAESTVTVIGEVSGMALEVTANVGDHVDVGQLLVRIDSAILEAQRAQSLAILEGAQAQLDQLLLDVDPEDMEAAQAAVNAAVAAYQDAVNGVDDEDLTIADTQIRTAEAAVRQAQNAYNDVKWNPKIGMLPQSFQLEQATLNLEAAKAQYQKVLNGAGDNIISGAYAQLVQARTQLTNLEEGPKPEQIRAVEAQVKQAEIALYLAQLQLDKATIESPVNGYVAQVNVTEGGMINPGAPTFVIVSSEVEITIPVEELRLPTLAIGQKAMIQVNAYPDRIFEGEIVRIAPLLDPQTRTVQVTIRPTEEATELKPGMFASVDLVE